MTPSLCWKVIVDGSIKGWKNIFFSHPPLPSHRRHPLPSYTHSKALYSLVSRAYLSRLLWRGDASRFELVALMEDGGDLKRPWYNFHARGGGGGGRGMVSPRDHTWNQKLWPGTAHADRGSLRLPYNQATDLTSIRGVKPSHLSNEKTVMLCLRFILMHQLHVIYP